MTIRQAITKEMEWIGKQPKSVFLGEDILNAGRIYHTLDKVPLRKCIEFPIAENLIMGAAIGLALEGYRPIVVFQRMDFMLIAADAIINHLAIMPQMSGGQFQLPILIRAIIGSQSKSFDVGLQHRHDFTHMFEPYIDTKHYYYTKKQSTKCELLYPWSWKQNYPTLIVEKRDEYDSN